MKTKGAYIAAVLLCFMIPGLLLVTKIAFGGISFRSLFPQKIYKVQYDFAFSAPEDAAWVKTYLPLSNERQEITEERDLKKTCTLTHDTVSSGRMGKWETPESAGYTEISYEFAFRGKPVRFEIPANLPLETTPLPAQIRPFLEPGIHIQSADPRIVNLADSIAMGKSTLLEVITANYDFVEKIPSKPISTVTDAIETLETREASCNGKSRLLVALCRAQGIPARLVGGMILVEGSKRTSHQWMEVYINGSWVPFDAHNQHFAELPAHYMELYRGDEYLITHTANIEFDYGFSVVKEEAMHPDLQAALRSKWSYSFLFWELFEGSGISRDALRILLLLPLAALVVALCRNVIGIKTFGVFLPALIAVSLHSSHFGWGMLSFVLVVGLVSLLHFPLEKFGLLHTPKMVIMLIGVVFIFLVCGLISGGKTWSPIAHIGFLPLIILTITAEKFARTIVEEGYKDAAMLMLQTLAVTSICFLVIHSRAVEFIFMSFPELYFLLLGRIASVGAVGRSPCLRISSFPFSRCLKLTITKS